MIDSSSRGNTRNKNSIRGTPELYRSHLNWLRARVVVVIVFNIPRATVETIENRSKLRQIIIIIIISLFIFFFFHIEYLKQELYPPVSVKKKIHIFLTLSREITRNVSNIGS